MTKIHRKPVFSLFLVVLCSAIFSGYPAVAADHDQLDAPSCIYCGMDRVKFAHSRGYISYDDGSDVGTCSLHCAAIDLSVNIDKTPDSIRVADYASKKLIDAETAHWVIGGNKMGVMTKRAKWAFLHKADAQAFINAHGGVLGSFGQALQAAFEDMYEDLKMIRKKRQQMKKKGS